MIRMICTAALTTTATLCAADISYVEEIVNSGIGAARIGASKTVRQVYVKGQGQHVRDEIKTAHAVEVASTILRLDRLRSYEIDHASQTFTERKLSPPEATLAHDRWRASHPGMPGKPKPAAAKKAAPKAVPADPNREVTVDTKELPDTTRIEGILCRRVAMQMRVRYFEPGSKTVKRENRYLYQAWVAGDFPGYADIERFEARRKAKATARSHTSGGSSHAEDAIEDYDRLEEQIQALEGFPLQSQLKVFTVAKPGAKEAELFRLSRTISSISRAELSPSLFEVSKGMKRVEAEDGP